MKIATIFLVAGFSLWLAGCGGDTYVNQGSTTISKGQELTDLQRAQAEGAITQREYEELRAKVMRRAN
jgi:hypothetical protein